MKKSSVAIRTPDQKLRVFISSTLKELAEERKAARSAVELLHLIPVMFELGARPHPPKDLYQAYLDQSNVFVGIYWQSYGWVAEKETISGLEDEFRLSDRFPRLIYVKEPAEAREDKLNMLLNDIRSKGNISYKSFSTPEELSKLIADDLAILISERFYSTEESSGYQVKADHSNLPVNLPSIIGREKEIKEIKNIIINENRHLITITGPGGIGKTRLSQEAATELTEHFEDGIYFIDLSGVINEEYIFDEMAAVFGISLSESGEGPRQISEFISSQKILIILDNFEHLSSAAGKISNLTAKCPNLTIIITSRNSLNITLETEYRLQALDYPMDSDEFEEIFESPSVKLFYSRARSVDNKFIVSNENVRLISEICRLLEGIPLAIELAAVKVRLLSPQMIKERLSNKLLLLSGGSADAPARHKTMKAAIEWSYELLNDDEKKLFRRLSVFVNGFDFAAIENICCEEMANSIELTESLLIKSLIRKENELLGITRYGMLEILREYALELFANSEERTEIKLKHADYFLQTAKRDVTAFSGPGLNEISEKWEFDLGNVLEAVETFLEREKYSELINLVYSLWPLFWIYNNNHELEKKINLHDVRQNAKDISPEDSAKINWLSGVIAFDKEDYVTAEDLLQQAYDYFLKTGNKRGIAWCHHLLTSFDTGLRPPRSNEELTRSLEESIRLFKECGDLWGESTVILISASREIDLKHYSKALKLYDECYKMARIMGNPSLVSNTILMKAWPYINRKEYGRALQQLKEAADILKEGKFPEALCYCLAIMSYYFFKLGDNEKAMTLAGACENVMTRFQYTALPTITTIEDFIDKKIKNNKDPELSKAHTRGLNMGIYKAAEFAHKIIQAEV